MRLQEIVIEGTPIRMEETFGGKSSPMVRLNMSDYMATRGEGPEQASGSIVVVVREHQNIKPGLVFVDPLDLAGVTDEAEICRQLLRAAELRYATIFVDTTEQLRQVVVATQGKALYAPALPEATSSIVFVELKIAFNGMFYRCYEVTVGSLVD